MVINISLKIRTPIHKNLSTLLSVKIGSISHVLGTLLHQKDYALDTRDFDVCYRGDLESVTLD